MKIRFCNLCERNIAATKKFNWALFLLTFWLFGLGFIYVVWYFVKSKNRCPICGNTHLLPPDTKAKLARANQIPPVPENSAELRPVEPIV